MKKPLVCSLLVCASVLLVACEQYQTLDEQSQSAEEYSIEPLDMPAQQQQSPTQNDNQSGQ